MKQDINPYRSLRKKLGTFDWGYYSGHQNGEDYKTSIDASVKLAVKLGLPNVRMSFAPGWFTHDANGWHAGNGETIQYLLDQLTMNGLKPVLMVSAWNSNDVNGPLFNGNRDLIVRVIRDLYIEFIKQNANRGIIWEGFNEPNLKNFWFGMDSPSNPEVISEWIAFDDDIYQAVQRYDPSAAFLTGVTSQTPVLNNTWNNLYDKAVADGMLTTGDAYAFHPYLDDHRPEDILTYAARSDTSPIPSVATEFGLALREGSQTQKGAWLLRQTLLMDSMHFGLLIIYQLYIDQAEAANGKYAMFVSDEQTEFVNMLTDLMNQLGDSSFITTLPTGNANVVALLYYSVNDGFKIVYWSANDANQTANITFAGQAISVNATMSPAVEAVNKGFFEFKPVDSLFNIKSQLNDDISQFNDITATVDDYLRKALGIEGYLEPIQEIKAKGLGRNFYLQIHQVFAKLNESMMTVVDKANQLGIRDNNGDALAWQNHSAPSGLALNKKYRNEINDAFADAENLINLIINTL